MIQHKLIEIIPKTIWDLAAAKNYLRILHDYDDELINNLLFSAIELAENFTGLSLNLKRIEMEINTLPQVIHLRYKPILEISEFIIITRKGEQDVTKQFGQIGNNGNTVFVSREWVGEESRIEYMAGYKDIIPRPIQHGILLHIAAMYDSKENASDISPEIRQLYEPYRMLKI